jgi:hypothetical protein
MICMSKRISSFPKMYNAKIEAAEQAGDRVRQPMARCGL